MLIMSQTSRKHWFGNRNMTSSCDATHSARQIQMTTICHWMTHPWRFYFLRTPLAGGSAEADQNFLGRNSQPQFHAVVTIQTSESLHRVPLATQTFSEGSVAAKRSKSTAVDYPWVLSVGACEFCVVWRSKLQMTKCQRSRANIVQAQYFFAKSHF